ncbi:3898_t:CDS:1, partial [Cetraspora pellucida]
LAKETFERKFEDLHQNFPGASSYLEVLYCNKAYWAHCFICFKFTGSMISSFCIELVNGCLKRLLYSSNVSLYELMNEIHRLLDFQDKKEEYNF